MKPPPLRYERAGSAAEAIDFLAANGDEAKLLAGGQSLIALLNMRFARPEILLDIGPLDELREYGRDGEELAVGAMVTQRRLELDPAVATACPLLAAAIPHVAHVAIRNRGTVGGTIAHGDAAAELPVVLAALGGRVTLCSTAGTRSVGVADFFDGFLMTAVRPDELVWDVRFPATGPGQGTAFVEFARRPGDFALVSVACVVDRDDDGAAGAARIALGGIASVPVVIASDALAGASGPDAGAAAAALVDERIETSADIHGSAEYRRHLARRLTARAIESALQARSAA
jgi:aerobic carbon-monoxide dehydrogenase medium subunit